MKNKDATPRIQARLPFKGNNMFGETVGKTGYAVYSYGYHFPMAAHSDDVWFVNEERNSPTTNRHLTIVRHAVSGEYVSTIYLKQIIGAMK
jgi:hypothetical protein